MFGGFFVYWSPTGHHTSFTKYFFSELKLIYISFLHDYKQAIRGYCS